MSMPSEVAPIRHVLLGSDGPVCADPARVSRRPQDGPAWHFLPGLVVLCLKHLRSQVNRDGSTPERQAAKVMSDIMVQHEAGSWQHANVKGTSNDQ